MNPIITQQSLAGEFKYSAFKISEKKKKKKKKKKKIKKKKKNKKEKRKKEKKLIYIDIYLPKNQGWFVM